MFYCPPTLLRPTLSPFLNARRIANVLNICRLTPNYLKTSLRPFSNTIPRTSANSPASRPTYQVSQDLKELKWPEENRASSVDECGGFYPVRLGETFDEERFVITKKLGWGGFSSVWLTRDCKDDRFVALKILSSHASREIEAGRLKERDILRKVSSAAPSHHGYQHIVHLLHEFEFESFAGRHICFVTDVSSYSVPNLLKELPDQRLPLKFILRLTKHVLKGLKYLHNECKVVHSDLKPGNLLLLLSDIDTVVMHELIERPPTLYEFPKTVLPDELPFHPVVACPLLFDLPSNQDTRFHWVITDLGHTHVQDEHLSNIIQPYALRALEVILSLE
ncbi:kinase-like protein [Fomitiporia mediterranea MF3/22]|uniref:kinase-like protein n=1 Tax=Fomitiporia mediterranea (strain MF3/22) TaxID=694068 RepID=UPI00044083A3|nr:kinase-like protein [Fomitiporia mediterranea MF3/22]EJC99394.1 kinase-like protein [Fomitiporia mediterranea MF3/22]